MKKKFSFPVAAATFFYSGFLPAPGTCASFLVCVLYVLVFKNMPDVWYAGMTVFVCLLGWPVTKRALPFFKKKDPGQIVIDEVAGQLIALYACGGNTSAVLAAFGFFRLLDIYKPPPVGTVEKFPGATGIMADDIVAGVIALALRMLFF